MSANCIFILSFCVFFILWHFIYAEYRYSSDGKCTVDGINGTCVKLANCTTALEDLANKNTPQICSFDGLEPVICCKDAKTSPIQSSKDDDEDDINDKRCERREIPPHLSLNTVAKKQCYKYRVKLLQPCRYRNSTGRWEYQDVCRPPEEGLIVGAGGRDAERNKFKHMALLLYGDGTSLEQFCGGSVISERFILTAAHCTSSASSGQVTTAVTGLLKLSDPEQFWRRNKIRRALAHPQYRAPHKYHDIALLETVEKIKLDEVVVPICRHEGEEVRGGVLATGWGKLGSRESVADTLQAVPLFKNNNCSRVYGPMRLMQNGFDDNTQMCFGDDGTIRDTCQGDSGGPVQIQSGRCLFTAVAVTSFGLPCAKRGQPAVYTRIQYYVPWITGVVWPGTN